MGTEGSASGGSRRGVGATSGPPLSAAPSPCSWQEDEELLKGIQAAILQVQGDCEKLGSVTGNLVDDHQQKQKDIEVGGFGIPRAGDGEVPAAR